MRAAIASFWQHHRKQLQARSPNATTYVHDLDGNFTPINRAGERLSGYSLQEILGLHVSQLVEPRYLTRVRKMIERTLDAQVEMVEEVEFMTKEGHYLTVAVGVHSVYQEGKAIEIQRIVNTLIGCPPQGLDRLETSLEAGLKTCSAQTQKTHSFTIPTRQEAPLARRGMTSRWNLSIEPLARSVRYDGRG